MTQPIQRTGDPQARPDSQPDATGPAAEPSLGILRFFREHATLVQVMSLVFAGAAFLRAAPKDDAVLVLMLLLLIMGLVLFARLWSGLPRELGVLPGADWTIGLVLIYYCLTISLVIAVVYLLAGFVEQRHRYLPVALGTLLALGGAAALTHRATAARHIAAALTRRFGAEPSGLAARLLVAGLLVVTVGAAFIVSSAVSPPLNAGLDRLFGAPLTPVPR